MSITVNMKTITKLTDAAEAAFGKWKVAGSFALTQHAGYSAALKANAASKAASQEVLGYLNAVLASFDADPAKGWDPTDPSWYQKLGKLREGALYQLATLANAKALVVADLLAHVKLSFSPSEASSLANASPEATASAVDDKEKRGHPNTNAQNPSGQDSALPPVDLPPGEGESKPWGLYAGLAAGGALLLKILKVW